MQYERDCGSFVRAISVSKARWEPSPRPPSASAPLFTRFSFTGPMPRRVPFEVVSLRENLCRRIRVRVTTARGVSQSEISRRPIGLWTFEPKSQDRSPDFCLWLPGRQNSSPSRFSPHRYGFFYTRARQPVPFRRWKINGERDRDLLCLYFPSIF